MPNCELADSLFGHILSQKHYDHMKTHLRLYFRIATSKGAPQVLFSSMLSPINYSLRLLSLVGSNDHFVIDHVGYYLPKTILFVMKLQNQREYFSCNIKPSKPINVTII
jgi:hypothetical protein